MARARLDPIWWQKNRPTALSSGALQQALEDFAKVSRTIEKSEDVGAYFKAISKLKAAIAKDSQILKKSKDKDGLKLLAELEKQAHSQSQAKQKQLTIKSELALQGLSGTAGAKVPEAAQGGDDLAQITNTKDRSWNLIKSNQVVFGAKNKSCQAIPKGTSVRDLTNWHNEQVDFAAAVRSQGNTTPLSVQFRLQYSWGGKSPQGAGAFLDNCRLSVSDARVPWGFTVDADVQVGKPYNAGSRKAPVGAIPLKLTLNVVTSLDRTTKSWAIHCHGNKKREIK